MAKKRTAIFCLGLIQIVGCGYEVESQGDQTITKQKVGELRYLATMSSIADDVESGSYCGEDLARRCGVLAMTSCMIEAEFGWAQFIPDSLYGIFNRYVDPNSVIPSLSDTGETVGQWTTGVLQYWLDPTNELGPLFDEMLNYCAAVLTAIDGTMAYQACVTHGCARGDCTGGIPLSEGEGTELRTCQQFKDLSDPICELYFDPSQCEETRRLLPDPEQQPANPGTGGTQGGGSPGGSNDGSGGYDGGGWGGGPSGGGAGGGYTCYATYEVWNICTYVGGALVGCYQDELFVGIDCYENVY